MVAVVCLMVMVATIFTVAVSDFEKGHAEVEGVLDVWWGD